MKLIPFVSHLCLVMLMIVLSVVSSVASAKDYWVTDIDGYEQALSKLVPGDTVILQNGVWNDVEILFEAVGRLNQPITLQAQTKGKVIISGKSNLRLAGEHLVVSGLVFKRGSTPTSAVIAFRKDKTSLANHSRVTETVIHDFSQPERFENDSWVMLYGRHNRFDHNHLEGKKNKGVTMAVRLNTELSQQNHHRIDHNYFGPRSILGSNGGETLRIGTSHHSLSDSFTVVEHNYFDRCDGELEIISNKSGNNRFTGNVFYQSRGTLTLRHGNDTLVENNIFLGNGADHTGGIRVINKRQTVRNNYLEGLAGYRFGGALVVMNGVPNSSINRYHQVIDSVIENNSLVNSDHIQLAAGSDFERSAVPLRTRFANNLIHKDDQRDPFTIYDDINGISFTGNVINEMTDFQIDQGFEQRELTLQRANNGLLYPHEYGVSAGGAAGVAKTLTPIAKSAVGVSWYPKPEHAPRFDRGKTIAVEPGLDTLPAAVKQANDGDVLSLAAGDYSVSRVIDLTKAITVAAGSSLKQRTENDPRTVSITFQRGALFELQEGGNLKIQGVRISGKDAPDSSGNSVVRTQRRSMLNNYELRVHDSEIVNLDVNHTFNFLTVFKGTFADLIEIKDSRFKNISGAILSLSQENDDFGIYNAEVVDIKNSHFIAVRGDLVDYYRGGTDESTFGPHFYMTGSTLDNVGLGKRNKSKSAIFLHGVQVSNLNGNRITNSAGIKLMHTVGEPISTLIDNRFVSTPEVEVRELYSDQDNTAILSGNVYDNSDALINE